MRRSATAHNPGVSLFPFLAVLICTMGVMMLLLVIINRNGSGADGEASVEPPPDARQASAEEIKQAREALVWKISQLESAREQTEGDLSDRRLRLSAVEQHMRELRDQWQGMQRTVEDLKTSGDSKGESRKATTVAIANMADELARTKSEIARAAERHSKEAPSFAIIPYDGPNGTRRRPIYIECGPDNVVLQPEGISLTVEDFEGPDGPGNPLASALRAARDYVAAQNAATGVQSEPYPLLIVRPDGIIAFYAARGAMASWASEFGYELVEKDQPISYPAADARLAQVESAALADARQRYAWFAQTRTSHKQAAGSHPVYRASVTGGGVVQEGASLAGDIEDSTTGFGGGSGSSPQRGSATDTATGSNWGPTGGSSGGSPGGAFGSAYGAGASGGGVGMAGTSGGTGIGAGSNGIGSSGAGSSGQDHFGFGNPYGEGSGSSTGGGSGLSSGSGPGSSTSGANGSWAAGNASGQRTGGSSRYGSDVGGGGAGTSGGFSAERSPADGAGLHGAGSNTVAYGQTSAYGGPSNPGSVASPQAGVQAAGSQPTGYPSYGASQAYGSQASSGGPSSGVAGLTPDGESHGAGAGEAGPGSGGVSASFNPAMQPVRGAEASGADRGPTFQPGPGEYVDRPNVQPESRKKDDDDSAQKSHSLADKRGRNWSLPSNARTQTAVSRPIRIECRGDQMIIKPDAGNSDPQVIPFKGRTEDSVDPLVAAIWLHTKGWGLAGRQMYWHPVLLLEMGPSGEGRFGELQALMADSGLEIRRK